MELLGIDWGLMMLSIGLIDFMYNIYLIRKYMGWFGLEECLEFVSFVMLAFLL